MPIPEANKPQLDFSDIRQGRTEPYVTFGPIYIDHR